MKRFDIITIFPKILDSYFSESLIKKLGKMGLLKLKRIICAILLMISPDRVAIEDPRPNGRDIVKLMTARMEADLEWF